MIEVDSDRSGDLTILTTRDRLSLWSLLCNGNNEEEMRIPHSPSRPILETGHAIDCFLLLLFLSMDVQLMLD